VSWLYLSNPTVAFKDVQALLRTPKSKDSEREKRPRERRGKAKQKEKGGREKTLLRIENRKNAGSSGRSGSPGGYQALLPRFPSSQHCSESVQVGGKGRRGMVLRRVCKELHGSCPGAPHRALLRGTGALGISACAQCSKGITHGDQAPEPPRSQCQQQLCVLGLQQFLGKCVPQREGNPVLPAAASVGLSVLSGSVIVGAVFLFLAEPV